ncbi:MAG TPA: chemotaxis protein CheB, partial [Methylocystis sp.]|nr:chemotaxis protein CheB [Methylocystis sp.]
MTGDDHLPANPAQKADDQPDRWFPTVGIGASAGGVRALQEFFENLPDDLPAAFVVIVHLDPGHQSELPSILAAHTKIPVSQVAARVRLEPRHVYVIPPNRQLLIADQHLSLVEFDEPRWQRTPIDMFFTSLAAQRGDDLAIILSGAGSDGVVGIKAMKEAGGLILVQDPEEAEYGPMRRSAIATGVADLVLPVRKIAQRLPELIALGSRVPGGRLAESDEETVQHILSHICIGTGHDFSKYKKSTILRRVARRMQAQRVTTLAEYLAILGESAEEDQALFADLLISVTTFFRDAAAFNSLAARVIPTLFEEKGAADAVRVWAPGCATGEEAYSIAILLMEERDRRDLHPEIQVFASDVDEAALAFAREGRYPPAIEADLSEKRLWRFFTREADHYRVKRELRDVVLFSKHSLFKDPPFSRLDLISCRNLLIYLGRDLQQQVCLTFHFALLPGGYLFLGTSESADNPGGLFRVIDRDARIFRRASSPANGARVVQALTLGGAAEPLPPRSVFSSRMPGEVMMHREALERNAPPSVIVDESFRVVHLSETAGRYLQPSAGTLANDITELAREELRFDLRAALNRVFSRGEASLSPPIPVRFNGAQRRRVYLQVKLVRNDSQAARTAVVFFFEGEALGDDSDKATNLEGRAPEDQIRELQQELQFTQSQLRTSREEYEGANEELRAANEELQSINEEYRSTAEELETSKEELQSTNEELQTVNSELKSKLDSISRAHSDIQNLMAATDVGILFLDNQLRIKRFTPRVAELFNVADGDEGRSITDFTNSLNYEAFAADAREVLRNLASSEREVSSRNGAWYLLRLRPYRTVENRIDGIVVTFVDISGRRRAEDALRDGEARLRAVFDGVADAILTIDE